MKNILVTGSYGYIGSVLCQKLIEQGYFVTGIDTNFYKPLLQVEHRFPFRQMDIRNIRTQDLYGFDAVVHLAALSNDALGDFKKEWTHEINFKATISLAKKAKKAGVKRFIFSSSCSVYGITKNLTVNEKSTPNPLTVYAKSKIQSEKSLKKLSDKNFVVISTRSSTVYGFSPAFRDDLVVNNLVACGLLTGVIEIKSDGTPWRPLIDVRDLSEIFIKLLRIDSKKINGEVINIGFNENNFQIKNLISIIEKQLPKCEIVFTGEHGNDSRSYKVNFNKFNKILPNTKQQWNIEKSIEDLIINLNKSGYTKYDYLNGTYTRQTVLKNLLKKKKLTDKLFWKIQS